MISAASGANVNVNGARPEQLGVRRTKEEAGPSGKTETQSHGVSSATESDVGGKTQSERRESGEGGAQEKGSGGDVVEYET